MARPDGTNLVKEIVKPIEKIEKKKKYAVNIVFDGEYEEKLKNKAKEKGIGVATYIKMLVINDINN